MKKLLIATLLTLSTITTTHASPQLNIANPQGLEYGVHYDVLLSPKLVKSNKVLVEEFFSYNCGSCYTNSKAIKSVVTYWGDKVEHVQVPLRGHHNSGYTAKLFYSLKSANALDSAHLKLLHQGSVTPETPLTIKETHSIIQSEGVDLNQFNRMYSSAAASQKEIQAIALESKYQIKQESVIVVNGRYLIKGEQGKLATILNQMIQKEHARIIKK